MATNIVTTMPLIVIAGPTASGKTSLAIGLAQQWGGEIICADSRTIYRGMDVGTAKPTRDEQGGVIHWGLDLVEPGEYFSVADFKDYAIEKIADIRSRGHVPFLVGGTGLYIDAVIFNFQFGPCSDATQRFQLEHKSSRDLQEYCYKNNITIPENSLNKRYLIRAIERNGISNKGDLAIDEHTTVVGITTNKDILRTRIKLRAEQLFDNNVVKEATELGRKYGWESEAMTGNIYSLVHEYAQGHMSAEMLKERSIIRDWQLAKRQITWLRRNPFVLWGTTEASEHYLSNYLANR